jgi:hypothetical protein
MRLLFLCSSLEPGRDGVGDFARQLADECVAQGHACALLALNDRYVDAPVEAAEKNGIPVLRLPSLAGGRDRAIAFRERFAPDWISLQLVAYGLHPKGLLFAARLHLQAIVAGGARLHLMLHELWLGNDEAPMWRHRVMGFLQRASLRRLIAALRPALITTTNPVYAAQFRTLGMEAGILPLCGNIPISLDAPLPESVAAFRQSGKTWLGLFFGGLYREWKPEPFFGQLARAARLAGRSVGLVQVGNAGGEGEKIWSELARDYASTFHFITLGPQPAPTVSALMLAADFGVAASPWSVIGKSGSAAAMLDHGLPVIVTRDDFQPHFRATEPPTTDPLVHRGGNALEAELAAGLPRRAPRARAPEIAAKLLHDMAARAANRP